MSAVGVLFAVSVLYSCEARGTSTVTHVFVQTGKDLLLDVKKPSVTLEESSDFIWQLNRSINIVKLSDNKIRISKSYKGRAEHNKQNYSLLLKNVKVNDSGNYNAHISGDKIYNVVEYKVTVQDPVSLVKLTVNVIADCNLTVTCSSLDSDISSTFRCDNQTCSQEGGERSEVTAFPASIDVYLEQGFIICNHSNNVSWEQDKKEIISICEPHPVSNGASIIAIVTGVGVAGLVTVLCFFLVIKYIRKNYGYTVPQDTNLDQTLNQTEDTTTYSLVGLHTGPEESTKTKNTSNPETVYAQVDKSYYRPDTTNTQS